MLQTIRSPRYRIQPFRLDGAAVNDALPERAFIDSSQRVSDLLKNRRIELRFAEVFARPFVGDALLGCIAAGIARLFSAERGLAPQPRTDLLLDLQKTRLVLVNVHDRPPRLNVSCPGRWGWQRAYGHSAIDRYLHMKYLVNERHGNRALIYGASPTGMNKADADERRQLAGAVRRIDQPVFVRRNR
jgi:hypothetical protein